MDKRTVLYNIWDEVNLYCTVGDKLGQLIEKLHEEDVE